MGFWVNMEPLFGRDGLIFFLESPDVEPGDCDPFDTVDPLDLLRERADIDDPRRSNMLFRCLFYKS